MLADPPTSQCSGAAAHPRRRTRNVQLRRVEVCGALSGRTHASECPGARNAAAAPRAHGCLDSAVRSSAPKPRRGASWPSSGYDRAKDDRVQHSIRARRSGAQDAELIALRLERVVPLAVSVCRRTGRRFRRMWGGQGQQHTPHRNGLGSLPPPAFAPDPEAPGGTQYPPGVAWATQRR